MQISTVSQPFVASLIWDPDDEIGCLAACLTTVPILSDRRRELLHFDLFLLVARPRSLPYPTDDGRRMLLTAQLLTSLSYS